MADKFFMITDNLVKVNGLKDRQTGSYENGATIKLSFFKQATLNIDISRLDFTSGGTYEPSVGQVIEGATDGAWAQIASIVLVGAGTWALGTAAGYFTLTGQHGTFKAAGENLDIPEVSEVNVATIASFSTGSVTANAGSKTVIDVTAHGLTTYENYIRIEGSQAFNGECAISTFVDDKLTIDVAFVLEKFKGTEVIYVGIPNGTDITLAYIAASDGNYEGILPDNLKGIIHNSFYYAFITITKGAHVKTYRLTWESDYADKTD